MSANKTPNVHTHRRRHSRRLSTSHPNFAQRHRKLQNHLDVEAARLNTVDTIAGVTDQEILDTYNGGNSRARFVRQVAANADATNLGIPIV